MEHLARGAKRNNRDGVRESHATSWRQHRRSRARASGGDPSRNDRRGEVMRGTGLAALAIDLLTGEPPATLHPTVGMGAWISRGKALRRATTPRKSLVEGATVVAGGAALTGAIAFGVERALRVLPA